MIINLTEGRIVTPTRPITKSMVANWRFARECGDLGGGLMPGAEMRVAEVSKLAGAMWVRAEIPGRDPVAYLKIAGEEFAHNFRLLR